MNYEGDLFGPRTPPRVKTIPQATPVPDGHLLVERVFGLIKVTRPDGSYVSHIWDGSPAFDIWVKTKSGIPLEKCEKILDYVWNFRKALVVL